MTNSVNSSENNIIQTLKKLQEQNSVQKTQSQNDDSIFGKTGVSHSSEDGDVCEFGQNYVKVKTGKKDGKETGLFQIEIYADEGQEEPISKDQCFIYKTDKNEKKYKFKTGQGNAVDFSIKGNDISVEVTNGNRKISENVTKIDDEKYKFNGKTYGSLDEIAVELNKIDLPSTSNADGDISASKQSQGTGDCSLLSVLNSLSHSEYGREVLEKCFVINNEKNTITVNLPGFGTSFEYNMDMNKDKKANNITDYYYSSGDAEAYFLERAMSDSLKLVKEGKIKLSKDAPSWCKKPQNILAGKPIQALEPHQVLYAMTGLGGGNRNVTDKDKNGVKKVLKECEKGETTIVAANLDKKGSAQGSPGAVSNRWVKDSFGNKVLILKGHSYAVKDVSTKTNGEKVITIIDPYDSSKEIVLNENTFLESFNVVDSIKIKGNNKHPQYYH